MQIKPFKDINSETMKRHLDTLEKIDNLNKAVQVANTMLQAISSSSTLQQSEIIKVKTWSFPISSFFSLSFSLFRFKICYE